MVMSLFANRLGKMTFWENNEAGRWRFGKMACINGFFSNAIPNILEHWSIYEKKKKSVQLRVLTKAIYANIFSVIENRDVRSDLMYKIE